MKRHPVERLIDMQEFTVASAILEIVVDPLFAPPLLWSFVDHAIRLIQYRDNSVKRQHPRCVVSLVLANPIILSLKRRHDYRSTNGTD